MADANKIVYLPQLQRYDQKIKAWVEAKKYLTEAKASETYVTKAALATEVPLASATAAGKVFAAVAAEADASKGEVKYKEGTGLMLTSLAAKSVGYEQLADEVALDLNDMSTQLDDIAADKTIVKAVEATGATASIADNKLTITVPTPEKYTLPEATETTLGGVYAAKPGEADEVIGKVFYRSGTGLFLSSCAVDSLKKTWLDPDVQATLDSVSGKANSSDVYAKTETYTKSEVDDKVSAALTSAIVPKGSIAFASLPAPAAANLGFMYNVTDAFTTTDSFVEGAGKAYAAGANVYVVNTGEGGYKFDVFMGFVDLSGYQLKADMPAAATDADIDAMFA